MLVGKDAAQKLVQRSIPVVSGIIGGCFDTKKVARALEVADIFYQKRFILEKEKRVQDLLARASVGPAGTRRDADGRGADA